ncbi:MAG: hypothetical protein WA667_17605, partial [Candidatus Nitrosopolaris sp.]
MKFRRLLIAADIYTPTTADTISVSFTITTITITTTTTASTITTTTITADTFVNLRYDDLGEQTGRAFHLLLLRVL